MKLKAYRRPGMLPFKEFSRDQVARWLREYRKYGHIERKDYADGSRIYRPTDANNPYDIALSA